MMEIAVSNRVQTTLDRLAPGEGGRVVDVDASGPLGRRLLEMGLSPGRFARMLRCAPLGDPIEIGLRSSNLSLRKLEAALVQIIIES